LEPVAEDMQQAPDRARTHPPTVRRQRRRQRVWISL